MQGWDKKAKQTLEGLLTRGDLQSGDERIAKSLLDRYADHETAFFTSKQRGLIEDLRARYEDGAIPKENGRYVGALVNLLEQGIPNDHDVEIINSLLNWGGRAAARPFSAGQKKLAKDLCSKYVGHAAQKIIYDKLQNMLEQDLIHERSIPFVNSILDQFFEKKFWTEIQTEHAEKIANYGFDPDDEEQMVDREPKSE
jgi:hypothetical protein